MSSVIPAPIGNLAIGYPAIGFCLMAIRRATVYFGS